MSSLMTNINNFSFTENYLKPKLSTIDIDVDDIIMNDKGIVVKIDNLEKVTDIKCDVYNMILKKDYDGLRKYAESSYMQTNTKRQTPLMLACKLGDITAVKILLNEVGNVSLNHKTAIDYAIENGDVNIIKLLNRYEKIPQVNQKIDSFKPDRKHFNNFTNLMISHDLDSTDTDSDESVEEPKREEKTKQKILSIDDKGDSASLKLSNPEHLKDIPEHKFTEEIPDKIVIEATSKLEIAKDRAIKSAAIKEIINRKNTSQTSHPQLSSKNIDFKDEAFRNEIIKLQKINSIINKNYGIKPFEIYYISSDSSANGQDTSCLIDLMNIDFSSTENTQESLSK